MHNKYHLRDRNKRKLNSRGSTLAWLTLKSFGLWMRTTRGKSALKLSSSSSLTYHSWSANSLKTKLMSCYSFWSHLFKTSTSKYHLQVWKLSPRFSEDVRSLPKNTCHRLSSLWLINSPILSQWSEMLSSSVALCWLTSSHLHNSCSKSIRVSKIRIGM